MKLLAFLSAAVMLSGCLGKMERITEETKASVERSNKLIEDTHLGQTFGTAYAIVNSTVDNDVREFSVEPLIILAKEERLPGYLGAADSELKDPTAVVAHEGRMTRIPNVSYVKGEGPGTEVNPLSLSQRNRALHGIYQRGVRRAVWRHFLVSQRAPNLSDEKREEYKKNVTRLLDAATIVYGAAEIHTVVPTLRGERGRHYVQTDAERRQIAGWLKDTVKNFSMGTETEQHLARMVEARLGVSIR